MPGALANTMNAGGNAIPGLVRGLPGAMNDPLGFYGANAEGISAVSGAAGALGKIAGAGGPDGLRFGAGLQLGYDPALNDFRIMAGLQGSF
jgi:hypothetical protein